ncbi:ABC transporter ATP-binding protein uup [Glaciecola punicea ACAM 611]|uniref:ATP-binding protein Uup n=1 Tax=Glaciecola punicea ACAM 611 TaxID=1121923 RepID=H5T9G8_9ALTE|nr:ATP-binding cassette domain-containing protein [Glaciecola punicea]GAB54945.1 ABC transporter ATP-binding protein uup [Glaciecola punicea ACAM 611]
MSLLQIKQASILFGQPPLLDQAEFVLHEKERVCVVGRNGSGKSTMLQVLSGEVKLDEGQRIGANHVNIARLAQDPPTNNDISLFDYVAEGLAEDAYAIKAYNAQIHKIAEDSSDTALAELQRLQEILDANNGWQTEQRINNVLSQLGLDAEMSLQGLSGGWRRKAALARALVSQPDILLLDEPTNHLDIDMVKWLEKTLLSFQGAIVFISHDRAFIRSMATRIVDIDRGSVTSYPGNYEKYLEQKAIDLEIQETHAREFDKKLAKEEVWIRQGIKARRTRNEGRVRALEALRLEFKARRNQLGNANIVSSVGVKSGKRVFELKNVNYQYGDKPVIQNLDVLINRGDKVAFIGPNGCGKTTLIKLLIGQLEAQSGEVFQGANLEIAYFDQHRNQLDLNKSLIDEIADGKREIEVNGSPRHVISYLQDYLFSPERANAPVSTLSGGEKNRLMLAKLMLKPSNLLILDEPTNDLDVETLELLESLLVDYKGTLLLVSHDREFIDNVVTSSLFFEGNGKISQFVGGYEDVQQWYASQRSAAEKTSSGSVMKQRLNAPPSAGKSTDSATKVSAKKLSYKEQQELLALPKQLETLEETLELLQQEVSQTDFYSRDTSKTQPIIDKLAQTERKLDTTFARWEVLESLQNNQ